MRFSIATLFLVVLFECHEVHSQSNRATEPTRISDSNWTVTLEGEWMIEFMAPWCPACRAFTEVWKEFATWGHDLDISVGVVDVTENPGLSGRFLVVSLPTVYHIKDGVFRQYYGGRKTTDLISVIDEKKWKDIVPVVWYRDPTSYQMGMVGMFFKAAMFIRGVYTTMVEVYGIPEWACYIIFAILTILIGLILGLLFVVCCDNFFPAKYIPLPPEHMTAKMVHTPPGDTDLIDDTEDQQPESNEKGSDKHDSGDGEDQLSDKDSSVRKRIPKEATSD